MSESWQRKTWKKRMSFDKDNFHDSALHPPLFAFTLILALFAFNLIPKKGKKSYEFEEWDSWRQDNGILCR